MSTSNPEPKPEQPSPLDKLAGEIDQAFPPGGDPAAPPAGAPEGAPAGGELLDEATIRTYLQVPFDFIAARKGAHWKLTEGELAASVPLLTKVSNKHAPEFLKRWGDEIALAITLGMIFLKRVNIDSEKAEKEKPIEPRAREGEPFREPPPYPTREPVAV